MNADLLARLAGLQEIATAIVAKSDHERRDLSPAELAELMTLFSDFENVEAQADPRAKLAAQQERLDKLLPPRYR